MIAREIDNIASRFPESLSEAQISEINEKAIPISTKIATKFGLDVLATRRLVVSFLKTSPSLGV